MRRSPPATERMERGHPFTCRIRKATNWNWKVHLGRKPIRNRQYNRFQTAGPSGKTLCAGRKSMTMTPTVKAILDKYESDNPGVKGKLAGMLMHGRLGGTGKMIILRSEEHTSELQSLMRHSYAVFCLKKKKN